MIFESFAGLLTEHHKAVVSQLNKSEVDRDSGPGFSLSHVLLFLQRGSAALTAGRATCLDVDVSWLPTVNGRPDFSLEPEVWDRGGFTSTKINLFIIDERHIQSSKEDLMMEAEQEKLLCLECWNRRVAKPGEIPPFPSVRLICDECGARKVLVVKVNSS